MMSAPLINIDGICNCLSTRKAARYLTAVYDKALAPSGVRITQFTILHKLARQGPLGVKQLASAMAMDRTTLAANLKPLERDGLIGRIVDQKDRRAQIISLSERGREKLQECLPLWSVAQNRFEDAYGPGQSASMRLDLERVLQTGFDPWAE